MKNSIKVLIEGYAKENKNGTWNASPSSVLLESNGKKILSDPGANSQLLLRKLKEENLAVDDIDIVFISHYHPDHILNIKLFPNHAIYDGDTIYKKDLESFFKDYLPNTDIKVIATPGHAYEHASLIIEVEKEVYVVAQDLFWWMDGKQTNDNIDDLINLKDPFVKDKEALRVSRKKILDIADWIIPGHGKMFKNPNK